MMRSFATLVVLTAALCGCSVYVPYVPGPHPVLVVRDGFKGEVFLLGDKQHGIRWSGAPLVIPESGILRVSNLKDLAVIRADAFDARYASGGSIQNRNRGGNWDVDGLWPITVMGDDHETTLMYLVVGSFHDKTVFDNFRMDRWTETIEELRADKRPNQPPEPTPAAGTSAAEQPLVPAAVVAHL